ncbi:hypothetical protein G6M89_00305 [Natronolimnobius sp. AArcel1]|uniref:hypothetical protein n=1 Tax=Natronolimnobius sp. AArcel1 TaxID=1679093 RepID=UPI0013EDD581|nr:hypothetical protein [Natronolimnobius sp. AArcel1]NGM67461.1 hypothetical protein [Natronolimnobius sp. AArcel1]
MNSDKILLGILGLQITLVTGLSALIDLMKPQELFTGDGAVFAALMWLSIFITLYGIFRVRSDH